MRTCYAKCLQVTTCVGFSVVADGSSSGCYIKNAVTRVVNNKDTLNVASLAIACLIGSFSIYLFSPLSPELQKCLKGTYIIYGSQNG